MTATESHWEIRVVGDASELARVQAHLLIDGFLLWHEPVADEWWMRWNRLDILDNPREALMLARLELATIAGVLKVSSGSSSAIRPGGIMKVYSDGRRDYHLVVTRGLRLHISLTGDHGAGLRQLAASNPMVAKALRLYGAEDFESWVGLFRLYEVIVDEAQGTSWLIEQGWISENDHRRFKHSANSVSVGGDQSRHGKEPTQPPSSPMSLADATAYVENLFQSWLSSKRAA